MIKFTVFTDSLVGASAVPEQQFDASDLVTPIEVSAIWLSARNGGIQGDLKRHLQKLCAKKGWNASELLPD